MKNIIITTLSLVFAINISAQLKVDSLGHVAIGGSNTQSSSSLVLNNTVNSTNNPYAITHNNVYSHISQVKRDVSTTCLYGTVEGSGHPSGSATGTATGVMGVAMNVNNGLNYGVVGGLGGSQNGAAVVGCVGNSVGTLNGRYAGYFYGNVYASGTMCATNYVTTSDYRLKQNISSLSESDGSNETLANVLNMNVVKFNYKEIEDKDNRVILFEDSTAVEDEHNISETLHFGLIAQELQEIYPNLVKEGSDGFLTVNYVELVPILIRSIQELKQEVDELRGTEDTARKAKQSTPTAVKSVTTTNTSTLYQNTPNPFKEQTVIRYRLADDAKNATICIFDMQGKLLKKHPISSGSDSLSINGYEFGEGMFLYTLMVNGQEIDTKRMILTK